MRLIHVETLRMREFGEKHVPPYAILSHTWGEDEISFLDLQEDDGARARAKTAGYAKIVGCCALAAADGLSWAWVDTCCIDKTSSVELSEAINSMFRWYAQSQVCYAYLSDVHASVVHHAAKSKLQPQRQQLLFPKEKEEGKEDKEDKETVLPYLGPKMNDEPARTFAVDMAALEQSRWFTRGWTLQELLAPNEVIFVDDAWHEIGSKRTLADALERITRISVDALADTSGLWHRYSIAQRFSWAAGRQTARTEDEAYCLLGLFGVSMPLLYGEGRTAFTRLEEEILSRSDDQSIFAWSWPAAEQSHSRMGGLLAPSPLLFQHSSAVATDIVKPKLDQGNNRSSDNNQKGDTSGDGDGDADGDTDDDTDGDTDEDASAFSLQGELSDPSEPLLFLHEKMQTWMDAYLDPYEIIRDVTVLRQPFIGPIESFYAEPIPDASIPQLMRITAVQPNGYKEYYVSPSSTHPIRQTRPLYTVQWPGTKTKANHPEAPYRYEVRPPQQEDDGGAKGDMPKTFYPVLPINDTQQLSSSPSPPTDPAGEWRFFVYRPAYILPLLCTVDSRPLCLVLSWSYVGQPADQAETVTSRQRQRRILQRVHMPSLLCLDASLIHLLQPHSSGALYVYARRPQDQAVDQALRAGLGPTVAEHAREIMPDRVKSVLEASNLFLFRLDALVAAGYAVASITPVDESQPMWFYDCAAQRIVLRADASTQPHVLFVCQKPTTAAACRPAFFVYLNTERPVVNFIHGAVAAPSTDMSLEDLQGLPGAQPQMVADMTAVSRAEFPGPGGCSFVISRRQSTKPFMTLSVKDTTDVGSKE